MEVGRKAAIWLELTVNFATIGQKIGDRVFGD
jgi:hypothetical protein